MGQITNIKAGNRGCSFNDRFYFEAISASSNIGAQGHAAYDGSGTIYTSENISSTSIEKITSKGFTYVGNIGDLEKVFFYGNSSSDGFGTVTNTYVYYIDEYGDIYIWMDIYMIGNSSTSYLDTGEVTICYPSGQGRTTTTSKTAAGGSFTSKGSYSECAVVVDENTDCSSSFSNSIAVNSTNPNCPQGSDSGTGTECGFPSFSVNDPNPSATTKRESSETTVIYACPSNWLFDKTCTSNFSINKNANLSEEINENFLFTKNKQAVDVKLIILEANQPQNCNEDICGEGGPEDCWGAWGGTNIAAKPTSQGWKTRVRKVDLNDEELQQFIVTVESKYYLQIPVEGSDPIRILVESGTDTFAGSQGRGSIHEFTNLDFQAQVGEPVYGCLNIKSIKRL